MAISSPATSGGNSCIPSTICALSRGEVAMPVRLYPSGAWGSWFGMLCVLSKGRWVAYAASSLGDGARAVAGVGALAVQFRAGHPHVAGGDVGRRRALRVQL